MIIKVVENKGNLQFFNEDVLLVSFNDSNYTLMTKSFFNKFNHGLIILYVDPHKGFIFKDTEKNEICSKVKEVYC